MSVLGPWPAPHRARKSCQFRGPFKVASLLCKQALKVTVHILPKACSQLKSHWLSLDQMWFVSTPSPPSTSFSFSFWPSAFLFPNCVVFVEILLEVEIDGGRGERAISAQEAGRDRHSGSLIGSCQGHDLPVCAGGRRANGATFIRAGGLGSPSLWKWEDNCIWWTQFNPSPQLKLYQSAMHCCHSQIGKLLGCCYVRGRVPS